MGYIVATLPVPPANGTGAAVAVDRMASLKTITASVPVGAARYTIEGSHDGVNFANLFTIIGPNSSTIRTTCAFLRVNLSGYSAPAPQPVIQVSAAEDDGTEFVSLPVPAGNGPGAAVDTRALGQFKSIYAIGPFQFVSLVIQVSADGVNWDNLLRFEPTADPKGRPARNPAATENEAELEVACQFMRTFVEGFISGAPIVTVGGTTSDGGSGGTATGVTLPPFADPEVLEVLYARLTGNDITGDGSLANPFRTTKRLCDAAPSLVGRGRLLRLDNGFLGTDPLPPDFQLPTVLTSYNFELDFADPFYFTKCGFQLRADPQPAAFLAPADQVIGAGDVASIVADLDNDLVVVTLAAPRAAYAGGALKGFALFGAFPLLDNAIIVDSTALKIELAYDGSFFLPSAPWTVMEHSTTLEGSNVATSAGVTAAGGQSMSLPGQKFVNSGPGQALAWLETGEPFTEFTEIEGFNCGPGAFWGLFLAYIHTKPLFLGAGSSFFGGSFLRDLPSLNIGAGAVDIRFAGSVADGCPALGARPDFVFAGFGDPVGVTTNAAKIINSIVDGAYGTPGHGIFMAGGNAIVRRTTISGAAGDGLHTENGANADVEGLVGIGNAGIGINNPGGGQVRVRDDATLIAGAGGDIKSGNLPVRTWANFRAVAPIKNEFDIVSPPVGDEITGAGTGGTSGARIFQRP